MPDHIRQICKESLACYYEYIGTNSTEDAEGAVGAEEDFDDLKEELEKPDLMCESLPAPENGKVVVEGYLAGSVATYVCSEEYDFIGGSPNRTCVAKEDGSGAEWDGEEPTCVCKQIEIFKYKSVRIYMKLDCLFLTRDLWKMRPRRRIPAIPRPQRLLQVFPV